MVFMAILVFSSAAVVLLLPYVLYDSHLPVGLKDIVPYFVCGAYKLSWLVGEIGGILGLEKNVTITKALEFISTLREPPIFGISYKEAVFARSVAVRIYTPDAKDKDALPGVVYYHGGGWCIGSTKSYHSVTKLLSKKLNAVVVSVDYRVAPQHVFPAAVDDCLDATKYFIEHAYEYGADPKRIAVMGDSAGGNLATVVSLKLRDMNFKPMPKLQVLLYPVTQMLDLNTPSYQYNASGPLLIRKDVGYFFSSYLYGVEDHSSALQRNKHTGPELKSGLAKNHLNLDLLPKDNIMQSFKTNEIFTKDDGYLKYNDAKFLNPEASPLMAKDLRGLPEAYISSCQYDVLRDDSYFYAHRLREAKVPVEHVNLHACYHGWLAGATVSKQANSYLDSIVNWMKERL